ncbi:MAG: hypothetical protein QM758_26505 [Armatimonas sp.]
MTRRHAILMFCALGSLLTLGGCGGSDKGNSEGNGRLADVDISPVPGATFVPLTTEFTIFWSAGFEPPPTFTARVYRLQPDQTIDQITSNLVREEGEFRWYLRPSGDLPANSAIYVELSAPGESTLRFSYIVGTSRANTSPLPPRPGGEVAKVHTIQR